MQSSKTRSIIDHICFEWEMNYFQNCVIFYNWKLIITPQQLKTSAIIKLFWNWCGFQQCIHFHHTYSEQLMFASNETSQNDKTLEKPVEI